MKNNQLLKFYKDYRNLLKRNIASVDEELNVLNKDVNIMIKRFNATFKSKVTSYISIINAIDKKLIRFYGSLNELQNLERKRDKYKHFINNIPINRNTDMDVVYSVCKVSRILTEYNKLKKLYDNIDKLIERKNKLLSLRLNVDEYSRMNRVYNRVGRKIILNGASYKISDSYGQLMLVRVRITEKNYKPCIDWKATKELKEHYIKNNIPIYNREEYLKALDNNEKYNGKEYLMYYNDNFYFYIVWNGVKYSKVGLEYKKYKFRTSYQNNDMHEYRHKLNKTHTAPTDIFDKEKDNHIQISVLSSLHWLKTNYEDYAKSIIFNHERYPKVYKELNTDDY